MPAWAPGVAGPEARRSGTQLEMVGATYLTPKVWECLLPFSSFGTVATDLGKRVRDDGGMFCGSWEGFSQNNRGLARLLWPWAPPSVSLSKYLGSRKISSGFRGLQSAGVRVSALRFHQGGPWMPTQGSQGTHSQCPLPSHSSNLPQKCSCPPPFPILYLTLGS